MDAPKDPPARNRFLMAVPRAVSRKLAAEFEPVILRHGMILRHPAIPVDHVYFPDSGLVSLVKTMRDGRSAEVGVIGIEGLTGVDTLLGLEPATFESVVQVDGYGRRIKTSVLVAELEKSHDFKVPLLGYLSYRINQLAQTAACNRLHTLRQRCCRWLLTAQDNVQAPTFMITHEFLALLMGVNRPSVSLTVNALQRRGIIKNSRASFTILKKTILEEESCECCAVLKRDAERMYRPDRLR